MAREGASERGREHAAVAVGLSRQEIRRKGGEAGFRSGRALSRDDRRLSADRWRQGGDGVGLAAGRQTIRRERGGRHGGPMAAGGAGAQHTGATTGLHGSQAPISARDSAVSFLFRRHLCCDQREEGLESGSVGFGGVEEDSGGQQSASILASS